MGDAMIEHRSPLSEKLFAVSANTTLQDKYKFSLKQTRAIIEAAGPGRAVKCVQWVDTLLESHPPGILGLVLTTAMVSIDNHGQTVRRSLGDLYGMALPEDASTWKSMSGYIHGAVQVLLAKAQRGDFGQYPQSVFDPPVVIFTYDSQKDAMDSTVGCQCGSMCQGKGGDKG